jgi:hypothetical protein
MTLNNLKLVSKGNSDTDFFGQANTFQRGLSSPQAARPSYSF